jgi:hypothetical protein
MNPDPDPGILLNPVWIRIQPVAEYGSNTYQDPEPDQDFDLQ